MSWIGKKAADVVTSGQQLANGTITAIKLAAGAVVTHLGYTPVNKAGDTMSGQLSISSSGLSASLATTAAFSSGFANAFELLAPNQTGGGLSLNFGKSNTTKNLGKVTFNYSGSGSNLNSIGLGFYDADNLFVLNASGQVTIPSQPCFRANTSGATASSGVIQNYPTPATNVGNCFDKTTGRFTATTAGSYVFFASKYNNTAANVTIQICVNGSQVAYNDFNNNSSIGTHPSCGTTVYLNVGDYVTLVSNGLAFDSNDYFSGAKIS